MDQLSSKCRRRPLCYHGNLISCTPVWERQLKQAGVASSQRWDRLSPGTLINSSPRLKVHRFELENGTVVYFKKHLMFGKPWRFFLRPSTAAVEFFSYNLMHQLGLATLETVAVGEIRHWGTLQAGLIITREIPHSLNLKEYALKHWPGLTPARRRQLREQLSEAICRDLKIMHGHGFFHFDPKWRNLLIRQEADGGLSGPWWIDSPRGKKLPFFLRDYGIVHDLASLARLALFYLSRSQRLRFLYAYCGPETPRRRVKNLALKIERHLQRNPPRPPRPATAG